jgi:glycosyltransferase involved in cell wall biosynthesis
VIKDTKKESVLLINNFYSEFGGEDSSFQTEIETLSKKYNVELLSDKNSKKISFFSIISILFLKNFKVNVKLKNILAEQNFKFVVVNNLWFTLSLGVLKILEKQNINYYVKLHNFRIDCANGIHYRNNTICHSCNEKSPFQGIKYKCYRNSYLFSFLITRFSRKFKRFLIVNNVQILCLSNFKKKYLLNLGFKKENINIISNQLVEITSKKNFEPSINFLKNSVFAIYAGRVSEEKGVKESIKLFLKTQNVLFDFFVVVGDGPELSKLKNIFKNEKQVLFTGQINPAFTKELISISKLVILHSKLYEGQPMLLLEASSNSVPVLTLDNGGLREFFPNDYPLICSSGNEMVEKFSKINDLDNLKKIGLKNKQFINEYFSRFSLDKYISENLNESK